MIMGSYLLADGPRSPSLYFRGRGNTAAWSLCNSRWKSEISGGGAWRRFWRTL